MGFLRSWYKFFWNFGVNFGIYSVICLFVVCSLCRGLKYLLKVLYFIQDDEFICVLVGRNFTECVTNQNTHFDTSICQMRLQVMARSLIFCDFKSFHTEVTTIRVWSIESSPNFHKLSVSLMSIFWCVNMPNVTKDYGSFYDLIPFLGIFLYYYIFGTL